MVTAVTVYASYGGIEGIRTTLARHRKYAWVIVS